MENEQCIFENKKGTLILGIYVDDAILLGHDEEELEKLLKDLSNLYEMTIDKQSKLFLGIEIKRSLHKLKLTQKSYSRNILSKFRMDKSKPVSTPLCKMEEEVKQNQRWIICTEKQLEVCCIWLLKHVPILDKLWDLLADM